VESHSQERLLVFGTLLLFQRRQVECELEDAVMLSQTAFEEVGVDWRKRYSMNVDVNKNGN